MVSADLPKEAERTPGVMTHRKNDEATRVYYYCSINFIVVTHTDNPIIVTFFLSFIRLR